MIFVDEAKIFVKSGKGGDGCISFRREKYIPNGGPNGGDGGRGGDIIFEVDSHANTLYEYRHIKHYKATSGEMGMGNNCHGKDGQDLILKVPKGTVIKDAETKKVIKDMSTEGERFTLLKGGRGGKGNQHYATATMQIPKYAQPGQRSLEMWIILELKSIADVGLVGFPNVGKSTFLARVSNARPKIANYHFTTLSPNLGVVEMYDSSFVIADIPGIIEGASEGVGLGHEFLKHIERTKVLVHVVDAAKTEGRDGITDIELIRKELEQYNPQLLNKPQLICANKMDVSDEYLAELKNYFEPELKVFGISAVTGQGVKELLTEIYHLLERLPKQISIFEQEYEFTEPEPDENISVYVDSENNYIVEGSKIERMLGYTNIEDEKGFMFFQNFLKENQIIDRLEELGINEGDTVIIYDLQFDYYK